MRGESGPVGIAGYQKHVDGIRALAIGLVVLYHFGLAGAERGFLGVDIFFVISGYLVGGHILRESASGRFDLVDFYCRRIARIVPALAIVAVSSLIAGYFILLPTDFERLAASIRAAMLITANQHFFASQDYFGPGKLDNYFLHSWSLSIEEQFYLFFPLIGLILARLRAGKFLFIALLALASAAWHCSLASQGHSGAFYYLLARSWELLVGVLVAIAAAPSGAIAGKTGHLALAGLFMAVAPAFLPDIGDFRYAIGLQYICVAGTALLLWSNNHGPNNKVAALLSLQSLVSLGLVSYSLYLIHWPLFTLARYWLIVPPTLFQRFGLLLLSIGLAWISWRWIEMPARTWVRQRPYMRSATIFAGLATLGVVAMASVLVVSGHGLPQRLSAVALAKYAQAKSYSPRREQCHSDEAYAPILPVKACKLGADTAEAHYAIWADSHGAELAHEMDPLFKTRQQALIQLTSSSCPPLLGVVMTKKLGCAEHNSATLAMLKNSATIGTVILMWHQNAYLDVPSAERFAGFRRTLVDLIRSGKKVIVVGPLPMPEYHVPSAMARDQWQQKSGLEFRQPISAFRRQSGAAARRLRQIAAANGAVFFDPAPVFCDKSHCSFVDGDDALFFDDNHLSLIGARKLALALMPKLFETTVVP